MAHIFPQQQIVHHVGTNVIKQLKIERGRKLLIIICRGRESEKKPPTNKLLTSTITITVRIETSAALGSY